MTGYTRVQRGGIPEIYAWLGCHMADGGCHLFEKKPKIGNGGYWQVRLPAKNAPVVKESLHFKPVRGRLYRLLVRV